MEILDKDFSSDWYSAILGNLWDNKYLSKEDIDILMSDYFENKSVYLLNITDEKAEIVRRALFENRNRRKFK
ncbi:MAG: hypothetical protein KAJ23_15375 [Maribacter sp.]|nr:hypothetical protein [Maribacter sp.]